MSQGGTIWVKEALKSFATKFSAVGLSLCSIRNEIYHSGSGADKQQPNHRGPCIVCWGFGLYPAGNAKPVQNFSQVSDMIRLLQIALDRVG